MPRNLLQRGTKWYARLAVPRRHWDRLGKREVVRTLGTDSLKTAARILPSALAALQRDIDRMVGASVASPDMPEWLLAAAYEMRPRGPGAGGFDPDSQEAINWDATVDHYRERAEAKYGVDDEGHPKTPDSHGEVIRRANAVMAGEPLLSDAIESHMRELAEAGVVESWIRAKRRELNAFKQWAGDVPVKALTRHLAGSYVTAKVNGAGLAANTKRNKVAALVSFGESLVNCGQLDANPFGRLRKMVRASGRGDASTEKRAYTPAELLQVLRGFREKLPEGDPLVDVAALCAYSGLRIEELADLRLEDVTAEAFNVRRAKNKNSLRAVPVHPAIAGIVKRLRGGPEGDGYLLRGLTRAGADKRRSHALSNRLRRWLGSLGMPDGLDTHSFRRSFATAVENAEIHPIVAKRLIGHKPADITYGLYSDGAEWRRLVAGMGKLSYGAEVDELVKSL